MTNDKICPLLLAAGNPLHMSKCRKDLCAWWDALDEACCICSAASGIQDAAAQINALGIIEAGKEIGND